MHKLLTAHSVLFKGLWCGRVVIPLSNGCKVYPQYHNATFYNNLDLCDL